MNDDNFFKNLQTRLRNLADYTDVTNYLDDKYIFDISNQVKESLFNTIRDIDVFLSLYIKSEYIRK